MTAKKTQDESKMTTCGEARKMLARNEVWMVHWRPAPFSQVSPTDPDSDPALVWLNQA